MNRKHPVKIKPNQHQGSLVGSILRPVSLLLNTSSTGLWVSFLSTLLCA